MPSSARLIPAVLAAAAFGVLAPAGFSVPAIIDFTASAANSGSNWTQTNSWSGGVLPADDLVTHIARFNQESYNSGPRLSVARSIAGLIIGDGTTATAALTQSGSALSIGASGIDMKTNAGAATLSSNVTLGANQVWNNSSANSLALGAIVSGDFAVEQTGTGTIILTGLNTFTGGYTLSGGIARLNNTNSTSFGTGTVTLKGGAVGSTSSTRTLTNAVTLNGNTQLGIAETTGAIIFTGAVNVAADSQVTLADGVGAGADGGGAFNANTVTLNGNLTIDSGISSQVVGNTFTSTIVDGTTAHGLIKTGSGNLILSADSTYSGGTTLSAGQLWLDVAGINTTSTALGTGTVTITGGILDLRGRNLVINALAGSGGGILDTATAGTRTLTVGQGGGGGAFSGNITQSNSAKIIAFTKTGSGTQKLSGANTYVGQTLVNAGTLLINGSHVDSAATGAAVNGYGSTSAGHFQVAGGATLGGIGRIQGNTGLANSNLILVQSGGHLAPGDAGLGAFTLDGAAFAGAGSRVLNMASGAVFDFQLSGTGGTPDQLVFWNYVSGDLLLNGNALNLSLLGTQTAGTYTVDLFTFYANSGSSIAATALSNGLVLGTLGAGISSATINYNLNTIGLTYTVTAAVPEPATFAVLGGLAALLLSVATRRRTA